MNRLCIALTHSDPEEGNNAYEYALNRRAQILGLPVEIFVAASPNKPYEPGGLERADGVCFTGGPDVAPEHYGRSDAAELCVTDSPRDRAEFAMLAELNVRARPVLAICRGAQILNVANGGTLVPDLAERNAAHRAPPEKRHGIRTEVGSRLSAMAPQAGTVNSRHHQAVERLAEPFRPSARADDGTLEAYEFRDPDARPFFLAVQWHPELMEDGPFSSGIFDAFLRALAILRG